MAHMRTSNLAEITLGKNLARLRQSQDITRLQLGRMVNKKEQEIEKYEKGEFVPLPVLEDIAKALGEPIPKKIIRRISFLRKLEMETGIEQEELADLYNEALPEALDY